MDLKYKSGKKEEDKKEDPTVEKKEESVSEKAEEKKPEETTEAEATKRKADEDKIYNCKICRFSCPNIPDFMKQIKSKNMKGNSRF